jgi:hypothetical protein
MQSVPVDRRPTRACLRWVGCPLARAGLVCEVPTWPAVDLAWGADLARFAAFFGRPGLARCPFSIRGNSVKPGSAGRFVTSAGVGSEKYVETIWKIVCAARGPSDSLAYTRTTSAAPIGAQRRRSAGR